MTSHSLSKDVMSDSTSRHSGIKSHGGSRPSMASEKSDRRLGDSSMSTTRRESKKLSRLSETVTVISDCGRAPDTCVLCGYGIPYTKCLCCDNEGHNRCIEAFYCTTGRRVNLDIWRCPKCVTLSNMKKENKEEKAQEESRASQVDMLLDIPEEHTDCPFCKIDMDLKTCECRSCVSCLKKVPRSEQEGKPQMVRYNKCLQYRDFSTKIEYKYLQDDDDKLVEEGVDEEEEEEVDSIWVRICWSVTWCLLLITFAFPIAIISAHIFIITYCFEACCECCHPVCCFFLAGIKLPGTCCRGICSGDPMCSSNDNAKLEKC
ncbi:uncharacterized protein LOC123316799 [Coccinella septempunctata]|uniref:uncharacterized protein LOC123316799 n=1 Tax=Coccinella septempunctata TaxID=41139 RepID=UPI001D05F8D5|nr:uncharacterized protein LOC123316799 [Coccinella septempunctata]